MKLLQLPRVVIKSELELNDRDLNREIFLVPRELLDDLIIDDDACSGRFVI